MAVCLLYALFTCVETSTGTSSTPSTTNQPKPTFAERVVEARITRQGFNNWEWKYTAEAVDVATGIKAKARKYYSKGGAKDHARINLKTSLLQRGIIRKD